MPPRFVPHSKKTLPGLQAGGVTIDALVRLLPGMQLPLTDEQLYRKGLPEHLGGLGQQLTQEEMTHPDTGRLRRWLEEQFGEPEKQARLIGATAREYGRGRVEDVTTRPGSWQEVLKRVAGTVPGVHPAVTAGEEAVRGYKALSGAAQRLAREDYERFIASYEEKGAYLHRPDGWIRTGPATYDPTSPKDLALRRGIEDRVGKALADYLGRAPTDDELVVTLVRLGHIPTPQTRAAALLGADAALGTLRQYLSQPWDSVTVTPGKGNREVQREVSRYLYDTGTIVAPDPIKGSTILAPIETLDKLIMRMGRGIGEVPAQALEQTGRFGEFLRTGEYKLPEDSPYRKYAGAMRGGVTQRILGESAALALPGIGFGPKGLRALTSAARRTPAAVAAALREPTVETVARQTPAISRGETIERVRTALESIQGSIKKFSATMTEDQQRRRFGGWTKAEIDAVAAGRAPPTKLPPGTPEYDDAAKRIGEELKRHDLMGGRLRYLRDLIEKVEKEYMAFLEYSPAKQEAMEEYGKRLTNRYNGLVDTAGRMDAQRRTLQGEINQFLGRGLNDPLPQEADALELLRRRYVPGYAAATDARLAVTTPDDVTALQTRMAEYMQEHGRRASYNLGKMHQEARYLETFLEDLGKGVAEGGVPDGVLIGGGVHRASLRRAAKSWFDARHARELLRDNPKGLRQVAGAVEKGEQTIPSALLRAWADAAKYGKGETRTTLRRAFNDALMDLPARTRITATLDDGTVVHAYMEAAGTQVLEGAMTAEGKVDPTKILFHIRPGVPVPGKTAGPRVTAHLGQVEFFYTPAGVLERKAALDTAVRYLEQKVLPVAEGPGERSLFNQLLGQIPEPSQVLGRVMSPDELRANAERALTSFLNPAESGWLIADVPLDEASRLSRTAAGIKGRRMLQVMPPPKGATRARYEEWLDSLTTVMRGGRAYVQEVTPALAVSKDTELLRFLESLDPGDPARGLTYLLGQMSPSELATLSDGSPMEAWGLVGDVLRIVKGQALETPEMKGLVRAYTSMATMNAQWTDAVLGDLLVQMRAAARDHIRRTRPAWYRRLMQTPGRTMQVWRGRWATGVEESKAVLRGHLRISAKTNQGKIALAKFKGLSKQRMTEVREFLSSSEFWSLKYPELFPGLPKAMRVRQQVWDALVTFLGHEAEVVNASSVSQATRNRWLIQKPFRDDIPQETLRHGDALDVLGWAAKHAEENNLSLWEVMNQGDELVKAEPMAIRQSVLNARTADAIAEMALPGVKVTRDDILHVSGLWKVQSLDKWPKELHGDLRALTGVMGEEKKLGVLTDVAQSIAAGVLTADANLVSLQAYPVMAMTAIQQPWRIPQLIGNLWTVTSDAGFHAWMRTNLDELLYYTSRGMRTGMESYLSGYVPEKLWWEHLPWLAGKAAGQVREFNDLQFSRYLMVLKVWGIRDHARMARLLRLVSPETAQRFMRGLPGLKKVVQEAGGEARYLNDLPDDVYSAIIRVVNNQEGGLSMKAQGVGALRQGLETLAFIVPSFFRAQAGMITTAVTRPNTLEGWLTITGMAQETLFAAALSYGFSMLTGNAHRWNWKDITRADWMAVQTDGGYIPIIPRMALPRMLARSIAAIAKPYPGAVEEVGRLKATLMSEGRAFETFVRGRFSPVVGMFYEQASGEDFLGRKFTDHWDRLVAGLTAFAPIFVENVVTDTREKLREKGWKGVSINEVLGETGLQYLGKNEVPRRPIEKLNEFSQAVYGRDFFDTTSDEQDALIEANPLAAAAWAEWEYYNSRRAEPKDQRADRIFDDMSEVKTRIFMEPMQFRDGMITTQAEDNDLLASGEMDGDTWREHYWARVDKVATKRDMYVEQLAEDGIDLDETQKERLEKFTDMRDQLSFEGLKSLLKWETWQIEPEDFAETIWIDGKPYHIIDWDARREAIEKVADKYPWAVQQAVREEQDELEDEGVLRYYTASEKHQLIREIPRYRGLDLKQSESIDWMREQFRLIRDEVRRGIGLPSPLAPLPSGMGKTLRRIAVIDFQQRGLIKTEEDLKLASLAIMLEEDSTLAEVLRNPDVANTIIANPDVAMFFPYLVSWVPQHLRGQLPEEILRGNQQLYDPVAAAEAAMEELR